MTGTATKDAEVLTCVGEDEVEDVELGKEEQKHRFVNWGYLRER